MKPKIVCLCGSSKFKKTFEAVNRNKTLAGNIVLLPGVFIHADSIQVPSKQKARLDELHLRKIDLADEVFVINKNGYIGESTSREIEYARIQGKSIYYLEIYRNGIGK